MVGIHVWIDRCAIRADEPVHGRINSFSPSLVLLHFPMTEQYGRP